MMNNLSFKKLDYKIYERYLAKDVTGIEFTFRDGSKVNLNSTTDDKVIVMKVYNNCMLKNPFIYSVIENYSSGINAVMLAERCGYDCFKTFQRHFKRYFNETVYKWILKRKMEDVHTLVINTDIPMNIISERFYFKSPAHLTNAYKKHFGISPIKNREQEQLEKTSHKKTLELRNM